MEPAADPVREDLRRRQHRLLRDRPRASDGPVVGAARHAYRARMAGRRHAGSSGTSSPRTVDPGALRRAADSGIQIEVQRTSRVEAMVRDLEAVTDALSLQPFVLTAATHMAIPALAYAARHPDRVAALILWLGMARGVHLGSGRGASWQELARTDWELLQRDAWPLDRSRRPVRQGVHARYRRERHAGTGDRVLRRRPELGRHGDAPEGDCAHARPRAARDPLPGARSGSRTRGGATKRRACHPRRFKHGVQRLRLHRRGHPIPRQDRAA